MALMFYGVSFLHCAWFAGATSVYVESDGSVLDRQHRDPIVRHHNRKAVWLATEPTTETTTTETTTTETTTETTTVDPHLAATLEEEFVNLGLSQCSCHGNTDGCAKTQVTFITVLVDIGKKNRPFDDYIDHLQHYFERFSNIGIVAYIDSRYSERAANLHPQGPNARTLCLIPLTMQDLPENAYINDYDAAMKHAGPLIEQRHPHLVRGTVNDTYSLYSAAYDVVQQSKAILGHRAAKHNVFESTSFVWLDGGLHKPMTDYLPDQSDISVLTCGNQGDRICYGFTDNIQVMDSYTRELWVSDKIELAAHADHIGMGATLTGNRQAWMNYSPAFSAIVREYLSEKVMTDDEGMMTLLALRRSPAVEVVPCNGYTYCPGYMLFGWNATNRSNYEWWDGYQWPDSLTSRRPNV